MLAKVLAGAWLAGVLVATLTPHGHSRGPVILIPLSDLTGLITAPRQHPAMAAEAAGNVLLFLPGGFLVPRVFPALDSIGRIALAGAVFSTAIETVQFILPIGRYASIDDVLLNTSGAIIGFLLYDIAPRRFGRYR